MNTPLWPSIGHRPTSNAAGHARNRREAHCPEYADGADVLAAFKATGKGRESRINAALREAVAHGLTKAQIDL